MKQNFTIKKTGPIFFYGLLVLFFIASAYARAQTSYTFTNAGATGRLGPTQLQLNSAYSLTNLNGLVTSNSGIQSFTIPTNGLYRIEAWGASGGSSTYAGHGAKVIGDVNISAGTVLQILVGQMGSSYGTSNSDGGGGGTFVSAGGTLLFAAGAGGGGAQVNNVSKDATITQSVVAGTAAQFGSAAAGYSVNGVHFTYSIYTTVGQAFTNGGNGQAGGQAGGWPGGTYGEGGFGGGGSSCACSTGGGGGGGGYVGGGGGQTNPYYPSGFGGSSYIINSATNYSASVLPNFGHGKVIITSLCNVSLNSSANPICSGSSATLTTDAVSGYSWSTGSNAASIVVSPTATTVYSVIATSSAACVASAVYTITVQNNPTVTIVNTASTGAICPGSSVSLTGSGASTYTWSGSVSNGVAFTPSTTAGYTVTGSNVCGISTAVTNITVNPSPTVTAFASTASLCSGATATLIGGSTGSVSVSSYAWSGGVTNGVSFAPISTAIYTVIGTSAIGCTASAAVGITVVTTPIAAPFASPPLICFGNSSNLNASGATNYTWTPGGFNTSVVNVSPTVTTTYTVVKANGNCVDTKTLVLYVNALPTIVVLASSQTVCAGRSLTLNAGGATSYTWTQGTFTITGPVAIVTPTATTIYSITAYDGTCTAASTVSVPTLVTPTISVVPSATAICNGASANITASGASTYTWATLNLNTQAVTVSPNTATSFSVSGTNSVGCTSGTTQVIVVNPNPVLAVGANPGFVCIGGAATTTVSGAHTYTWSTSATGSVTSVNPLVTSVYTVTGTYVNTGCNTSKTVEVVVFEPTLTVTSATQVCLGSTVTLNAAGAVSYTWNTGSQASAITVSPAVYTTYSVSATTSSVVAGITLNCFASSTIGVSVNQNPTVTASSSRTIICKQESTTLNAAGAVNYTWLSPLTTTGSSVIASPLATIVYTAVGTDTNNCSGTATLQIKVIPCVGINELNGENYQLSIYPNPSNGEFTVKSDVSISLNLINELGQTIRTFTLNDTNKHEVNVSDLPNGIYFIVGKNESLKVNQKIVVAK